MELLGKKEPSPKKKGKGKPKHTHIEHHANGSHTVRHEMTEGEEPITYAAPDMDAVKAGLDEHVAGAAGPEEPPEGEQPA